MLYLLVLFSAASAELALAGVYRHGQRLQKYYNMVMLVFNNTNFLDFDDYEWYLYYAFVSPISLLVLPHRYQLFFGEAVHPEGPNGALLSEVEFELLKVCGVLSCLF